MIQRIILTTLFLTATTFYAVNTHAATKLKPKDICPAFYKEIKTCAKGSDSYSYCFTVKTREFKVNNSHKYTATRVSLPTDDVSFYLIHDEAKKPVACCGISGEEGEISTDTEDAKVCQQSFS